MKIILSSKRHHYMAKASIFLVAVALIAGMVGCGQPAQYTPMVTGGGWHTVGVKSDGTVVAVGDNTYGQCDVGNWTDIIQVAADGRHTVGLKSDGTVVAVGMNYDGQCNVGGWTDIIQVAAGNCHTVGLKDDGTAVAVAASAEIELAKWDLF
jgi:alpha-tubulin suppressor-like RCC1 family protein